jgi:hypothetical protein
MQGSKCVVRVGGGYIEFEDYILKHSTVQYIKIKKLMSSQSKSFHEVFTSLLLQNLKDRKHILSIMKKLQWWIVRQAFLFGATALPTDTTTTTAPLENGLGYGV